MKWYFVENRLEKQGLTLFSTQELRRAANLSESSAKFLVLRHVKKGILEKLKGTRGLYCLKRKPPHSWFLANRLLRPSYISLETALSHYGLIPESVYSITSVTTGTTRHFLSMGRDYSFQKIKSSGYCGFRPIQVDGETVLIAEAEKALADFLYFVHLGHKKLNERIRWSKVKRSKLLAYVRLFKRARYEEWVKNVIKRCS